MSGTKAPTGTEIKWRQWAVEQAAKVLAGSGKGYDEVYYLADNILGFIFASGSEETGE